MDVDLARCRFVRDALSRGKDDFDELDGNTDGGRERAAKISRLWIDPLRLLGTAREWGWYVGGFVFAREEGCRGDLKRGREFIEHDSRGTALAALDE